MRHRRWIAADEHGQAGQGRGDPGDIVEAGEGGVDDQRVEPQCGQLIRAGGIAQQLPLPAERLEAPFQDGEQAAVVIDQG
jgi:hypothetical protein